MEIQKTTFGAITIDGKTYEHDVVIRLSGEVVKNGRRSCRRSTTVPHTCSRETRRSLSSKRGASSSLLARAKWVSPEAEAYFAKKGCKVLLQPTPEAIHVFNKSHAKRIGLFHVTC